MEYEEGFLNRFLAQKIGQNDPFTTELIRQARQGHLCMLWPDPLSFSPPIVRDENRYYLEKNWGLETRVLEQLKRLRALSPCSLHDEALFHENLEAALPHLQLEQAEAIRTTFSRSFSLICGGPGSGKTYTAAHLVKLLADSLKQGELFVHLAAPTGKAAAHLQSKVSPSPRIQLKASTLHRLLSRGGRIDADLVIVDEGSMIDVALWVRLLEAIGDETRLVILGDPDQLPPIEAGSLFSDLAPLFGVFLNRCMRTDAPHLRDLALAIQGGHLDEMFRIVKPQPIVDVNYLYERIGPWIGTGEEKPDPAVIFHHYKRLGVLNALRQGPWGVESLQRQWLERMRKKVASLQWWGIPILVTANEPRLDLYNGTFGVLIGQGESALCRLQGTVYFPNPDGTFSSHSSPPPITPAFCISIHKSQGSEFDEVIAIFPQGSERLGREALYTAVTRAKRSLEWVGDEQTLREMVETRSRRMSGIASRLLQREG